LAVFEHTLGLTQDGVKGPFAPVDSAEVPLLGEIEEKLGMLPIYYQVMARDPRWLAQVWAREVGCLLGGNLERLAKHFVALAVASNRGASYSVYFQTEMLKRLGATTEQLWEAMRVITLFAHNTKYTEGLLLKPGMWKSAD
jgi:alkylhydroperoxidase/carboxymuconolactone decarboxylase family protein YurZ